MESFSPQLLFGRDFSKKRKIAAGSVSFCRTVIRNYRHCRVQAMTAPENQAKSIFLDALEIVSESQRHAYIDRACADNATLPSVVARRR